MGIVFRRCWSRSKPNLQVLFPRTQDALSAMLYVCSAFSFCWDWLQPMLPAPVMNSGSPPAVRLGKPSSVERFLPRLASNPGGKFRVNRP